MKSYSSLITEETKYEVCLYKTLINKASINKASNPVLSLLRLVIQHW